MPEKTADKNFSLQINFHHVDFTAKLFLQGVMILEKQTNVKQKQEKMKAYKAMLTQKINELLSEAGKTVSEMTNGKENYPDPTDRASLESDRNFELRIRDRERKLIMKMQEAIKRIDDGTFGICEVCGGPISEKRLMARPVTTLCIDCKTKQEKMEKLKGE